MNRNAISRSATIPPQANIERSGFDLSHQVLSTFSSGKLIPIGVEEVLPGSTFDINMASICRMSTPYFPVMDSAFLDVYAFFVPNRLVWSHWKEFCGENNESAWAPDTEYFIPQMPMVNYGENTVADYFGIPTKCSAMKKPSALPFRAYRLIWNEWFRDQNLMDPKLINFGDIETDQTLNEVLPVCRFADYFTTCLPSPQKGDPVLLPLGDRADVYFDNSDGAQLNTSRGTPYLYQGTTDLSNFGSFSNIRIDGVLGSPTTGSLGTEYTTGTSSDMPNTVSIVNAFADLSGATGATINSLREAFAVQRFLERQARGGSRYREFLKNVFNVISPDATQQVPEYLGGTRIRINVNQVIQQSATVDEVTPLGSTGAFSKTVDRGHLFTKSFTEHGYVLILACVRCASGQTTQQGMHKKWTRRDLYDFYVPQFAHLGEQAVLQGEIWNGNDGDPDQVFGYQEAWAEYRYHPSLVCGSFRSNAEGSLDAWHYADDYGNLAPVLSAEWIVEPQERLDRTLIADSSLADQFLLNVWFDFKGTLPMPTYSVPGLIDHY